MIRNIIFDMGHVLLWYLPLPACQAVLADEADAKALCDAYFKGPCWVEVDYGRLDGQAFTDAVKAQLPERLHPAVDTVYENMPGNILSPVDGMADVVDNVLCRGFHVYLLSNAGRFMSRNRNIIPHIDRFHGVMFSGDEGLLKPDPRLYQRLMDRFCLQARECFFVDDNADNIKAAADLGWQTHQFHGDADALLSQLKAL